MNVFEWLWWGKAAVSDIQADAAATRLAVNNAISKINQLSKDVQTMGAREDAAPHLTCGNW